MTKEADQEKKPLPLKIILIAGGGVLLVVLSWFLFGNNPSGIERDDHRFTISASQWPQDWKNISHVLTQAKIEKIENPDGTLSLRVLNVEPKGAFAALGIEEEDIIISINNRPIYDIQDVLKMIGGVNKNQTIELGLKRGEQEEVLIYKIIQ
jgi:C-terminal processing protease CtpA/Prc